MSLSLIRNDYYITDDDYGDWRLFEAYSDNEITHFHAAQVNNCFIYTTSSNWPKTIEFDVREMVEDPNDNSKLIPGPVIVSARSAPNHQALPNNHLPLIRNHYKASDTDASLILVCLPKTTLPITPVYEAVVSTCELRYSQNGSVDIKEFDVVNRNSGQVLAQARFGSNVAVGINSSMAASIAPMPQPSVSTPLLSTSRKVYTNTDSDFSDFTFDDATTMCEIHNVRTANCFTSDIVFNDGTSTNCPFIVIHVPSNSDVACSFKAQPHLQASVFNNLQQLMAGKNVTNASIPIATSPAPAVAPNTPPWWSLTLNNLPITPPLNISIVPSVDIMDLGTIDNSAKVDVKCQCGSDTIGVSTHSHWCPKHKD